MRPMFAAIVILVLIAAPAASATTTSLETLSDGNGMPGDEFGSAVATGPDRVVAGAPLADNAAGAVFIYDRLPTGGWIGIKVVAADRRSGDQFGYSVALDGDRVVVGALFGDGAETDSGAAYLLEPAGDGFWDQIELSAPDGRSGDQYGVDVDISGENIIVGANRHDAAAPDAGAAYVLRESSSGWTTTKITAADATANDLFGRAVAVDAELAVVGSIYRDGATTDSGAAYVYRRLDGGWSQTTVLTPPAPRRIGLFGDAVDVDGERIVVGAPLTDDGVAYVFEPSESGWHTAELAPSSPTAEAQFGKEVAVSGDRILVGSPNDGQVAPHAGAAHVFELADAHWFETTHVDPGGRQGDGYGTAVALDADMMVIGVPLHDGNGTNTGRVYVVEPHQDVDALPVNFSDITNNTFETDIRWMAAEGITEGCGDGRYCPQESVTRAQMAMFLTRALDLPAGDAGRFSDVGGAHADGANAIAAAGISLGCEDGTKFCPYEPVTRAQMASFFARALGLELGEGTRFSDVRGTHAGAIDAIAAEGITLGCTLDGSEFCPNQAITRGQMAAFLYRALGG